MEKTFNEKNYHENYAAMFEGGKKKRPRKKAVYRSKVVNLNELLDKKEKGA